MSSYLTIKKKDTVIGEWSRSTVFYQHFTYAKFGDFEEFDAKTQFREAIDEQVQDILLLKEKEEKLNLVLQGLTLSKDRKEIVGEITENRKALKEANDDLAVLYFLFQMANIDDDKWSWMID